MLMSPRGVRAAHARAKSSSIVIVQKLAVDYPKKKWLFMTLDTHITCRSEEI
jgi:hypothetical protein